MSDNKLLAILLIGGFCVSITAILTDDKNDKKSAHERRMELIDEQRALIQLGIRSDVKTFIDSMKVVTNKELKNIK